jgi:hypothetical protein
VISTGVRTGVGSDEIAPKLGTEIGSLGRDPHLLSLTGVRDAFFLAFGRPLEQPLWCLITGAITALAGPWNSSVAPGEVAVQSSCCLLLDMILAL